MDTTIIEPPLRILATLLCLAFVVSAGFSAYRKMEGRPAGWGTPLFIFVVLAGSVVMPTVMRVGDSVGEEPGPGNVPQSPAADSPPEPPAADSGAVFSDIGQLLLIVGAGIFIVCGIVVGNSYLRGKTTPHSLTPAQVEQDRAADTGRLWGEHVAALHKLKQKFVEFETDPWSAFRRPLLGDVSEPETAAFHDAFAHAQDLHTETRPQSRTVVDDFGAAVRAATRAWQVADTHARKVAVPTVGESDRRRLRQAKGALLLAMDPATSAAERRAALGQVEKLIKGLTTMPANARTTLVAELDHVERQAITS